MKVPYLDLKAVTAMHSAEIQNAVAEVVDSGWYLQGQTVRRFELNFGEYCSRCCCVSVANGLDALTLVLRGYKELKMMEDGDEIIVPANTFIATVLAITDNNLKPVFVEPKYESLVIDDEQIEAAITPRTKAIMLVHLYGRNAYTRKIADICQKHGLKLIEDCAQAHGIYCRGDVQCYSFYPGKNLGALGDGGAVVSDDDLLMTEVRTLSNYGFREKYVAERAGRNSRLDEVQAAVLNVKLKYLDEDNERRQDIAHFYYENIHNPLITLPTELSDDDNVYHIFPILCQHRDELQQYLADNGIGTIIHYPIPPHKQQCYKQWNNLSLPITERIANEELSIPLNQTMTDNEAEYVVKTLNSFKLL